jgi:hypothetical protein
MTSTTHVPRTLLNHYAYQSGRELALQAAPLAMITETLPPKMVQRGVDDIIHGAGDWSFLADLPQD